MNKVVRAVARGVVVSLALAGLASVPGAHGAQAATAPQEGEHDVVVNPNPVDTTAHVLDGNTQAVVDLGSRVIVGGKFTQVKRYNQAAVINRANIFAYDKATGAIDTTFVPALNGQVTAMVKAPDGNLIVSGQFKTVNGVTASYLVKIDPVTGAQVTAFNATPNGMVYDLHLHGSTLFVGGTFTKMRNIVRTNFAMLDATTGKALGTSDVPFTAAATGTTRVMRLDVTPDGTALIALGNFTQVGGQYRPNVVKLDLAGTTATVSPWFTDGYRYGLCSSSYDTFIRDVDFSPDGSYFVLVGTGAYYGSNVLCDTASRWETAVAGTALPTWVDHTGGDTLSAVAVTGAAVYVAGHERWANNAIPSGGDRKGTGALDRVGIAALDPMGGVPLSWNPGRERGIQVWRMTPTPQGLYVLSDSSTFAGEWHPRLTYLLTAGGAAPVRATTFSLPTNLSYTGTAVSGGSAIPGRLTQRTFDGTVLGDEAAPTDTSDWSAVVGVIAADGVTYRITTGRRIEVSTDGSTWTLLTSWTDGRWPAITAATYANGLIYYTVSGDSRLYEVGFGVENGLVSTLPARVVSGDGDGLGWSGVRGLTYAGGKLLASSTDGNLSSLTLANRRPVPASLVQLSGPGVDSLNWSSVRALHAVADAAPPVEPPPLVDDHFDNGLDAWTNVVGLSIDPANGAPAGSAPSAAADVTGARASGSRTFTTATAPEVCAAVTVKVTRQTASTVLMRLRTAANGAIARVFITANRGIYIRSDVAGVQMNTGATLSLGSWTRLELCAKTAADGYLQLKVDGVATPIWSGNTGTANAGVIELGDAAANSWAGAFDDVFVDDVVAPTP